jgi:hypothetical protein
MLTFAQFCTNAGIDPAATDPADLETLRKSYDELQGLGTDGGAEATGPLAKAVETLSRLTKSPKMLADLLHHMQSNAENGGPAAEGEEPDDGGMGGDDGDEGDEDQVDEEELAGTMRDMGLAADGKDGEEGEGDECEEGKVGRIQKALMDELGATAIMGADEVVGTLLKAHGVALEAHSDAVLTAVDTRLTAFEQKIEGLLTGLGKSVEAAAMVPTPRGLTAGARQPSFGNPSLNPPVVDESASNRMKGTIISAFSKGWIDEDTCDRMKDAVGSESWQAEWAPKFADLEKKLAGS